VDHYLCMYMYMWTTIYVYVDNHICICGSLLVYVIVCPCMWHPSAATLKSSRANSPLWSTRKITIHVYVDNHLCMWWLVYVIAWVCDCVHNIWDTTAQILKSSRANSLLWSTIKITIYVWSRVYVITCVCDCLCMRMCTHIYETYLLER